MHTTVTTTTAAATTTAATTTNDFVLEGKQGNSLDTSRPVVLELNWNLEVSTWLGNRRKTLRVGRELTTNKNLDVNANQAIEPGSQRWALNLPHHQHPSSPLLKINPSRLLSVA